MLPQAELVTGKREFKICQFTLVVRASRFTSAARLLIHPLDSETTANRRFQHVRKTDRALTALLISIGGPNSLQSICDTSTFFQSLYVMYVHSSMDDITVFFSSSCAIRVESSWIKLVN